jgi:predicted Zn-dependent peptidase
VSWPFCAEEAVSSRSLPAGRFGAVTVEGRYPIASRPLDNGLRVIVSPTPGLGLVAVNLWYDVGSRHEEPHRQGFAHLFEHLMFQGSRHVGAGEHFSLVQGNGGSLNATTSFDRTNYFEVVPTGALDLALWLEADRMAYLDDVLTQENFDTQVAVVAAERSQRMDNVPYGTALEDLLPLVFAADHPYGHLPIGNLAQLRESTLEEVSAFHRRFYMPNNAVLTIVGEVAEEVAFERAEEYFGHLEAKDAPKRELPDPLPPVDVAVRKDLTQDVPAPAIWFAARLPPDEAVPRELAAVEMAGLVLGEGETSRLHRRLVREDEVALSAWLGVNTLIAGNSLAAASVRAVPGADLDSVAATVEAVIARFAEDGPTELELEIARAHSERSWLDDMGSAGGRADALSGCALLYDNPQALNERLPLLRSLTAEEVRAAAEHWLLPARNAQLRILPSHAGQPTDAATVSGLVEEGPL